MERHARRDPEREARVTLVKLLSTIAIGVAAGYAFLLAVGGTIEHFTP